ncbi:hypothetical protein TNCT_685621 [Trichonephila clavata]|uniref:Uncharacterized protein n=1 Tax=Trichonephila clavata TaxID=2740835 RepID=A0A8X6J440_TRICU|nr:hypothetical protein TNCT_685621 [Trichonephila clavata]
MRRFPIRKNPFPFSQFIRNQQKSRDNSGCVIAGMPPSSTAEGSTISRRIIFLTYTPLPIPHRDNRSLTIGGSRTISDNYEVIIIRVESILKSGVNWFGSQLISDSRRIEKG